jgi:hypothetical protein
VMSTVYHAHARSVFYPALKNTRFPTCKYMIPRIGTSRQKTFASSFGRLAFNHLDKISESQ